VVIGRCDGAIRHTRVWGCGIVPVVLAMVVIIVVVLAVSGLAFYAMHRSKPSRLRLSASLLKLASFSIEVESQDGRQGGKLPPASDVKR
jgi:Tfp pilus assembly protein PilV